nr:helix-turn-helix transcriptional regulator [Novosphingobium sp. NBM11]
MAVLLASGLHNKQVAYMTSKAENTVKVYRARVMQKMGVTTLVELARQLQRIGIEERSIPDCQLRGLASEHACIVS